MTRWFCLLTFALLGAAAMAAVTLPHVFSDHMVLQQGQPIPVWGTAAPGERVLVTLGKAKRQTKADTQGRWRVALPALRAARKQPGLTLTVAGTNTLTCSDVLIGEVWVCSGQSNMQWPTSATVNAEKELAGANFPQVRLFTVPNITAAAPKDDCGGNWLVCTPETAAGFSAVGFYFGRYLHQQLKVPVGLINTSWGGTICEAWTSADALRAKLPEFNAQLDALANPSMTLQQAMAAYEKKLAERQEAVKAFYDLEDDLAGAAKTAAAGFDDSAWKTMALPGNWETKGLRDLDGVVWFRRTLTLPASWAGKEIILRPGPIDDVDNTWFNGTLVGGKGRERTGETAFWNIPREYRVPGNLVKAGANTLAIRVFDIAGAGGLWGAPADTMYAELADGSEKTRVALAGDWKYSVAYTLPNPPPNPAGPNYPSVLYNAMIAPLIPYPIRGAIWYQGESNAGRALQYRTLLPTMIADWRARWGVGEFPFLIVQLANFMARSSTPAESAWAELREAQALTVTALPNVGLATAIDIGEANDIHPRNKQDVGLRLGLAARAIAYKQQVPFSGPTFKAMTVKNGEAILTFDHTDDGLLVMGDGLKGFAIAGPDGKFVWAQARLAGNTVILRADGVKKPTAVRYAWGDNPDASLYNGAGLPAVPFRTDVK
jgi:sialate O-acetylesterase